MKILILTSSPIYNAAGIVALDLYNGLRGIEGNEVKMIVRPWKNYSDKNIIPIESYLDICFQKLLNAIHSILNKFKKINFGYKKKFKSEVITNPDYYIQDYDQTIIYFKTKKILKRAGFKPDIVIALFMTDFISFKNLYEINKLTDASIFLYLMDMAPFTGGCHYAWDCVGYTKVCGNCPALYSNNQYDQTYINYMFKKKYIENTKIYPITGSEWQYIQLSKSSLFKDKRKFKVLLSINENQYCPSDKDKARQELGLPDGKKIIFFGAVSISEKRKGFRELIETLNILSQRVEDPSKIHLAIAGNKIDGLKGMLPFSYTMLGYLGHNIFPMVFKAADIFVCPSIEDSGPMMINQSIMSGTPVVAFEMGVALDLVQTGQTGYRAKLGDTEDMANGIKKVLLCSNEEYSILSKNCRNLGIEKTSKRSFSNSIMRLISNQNVISNLK
jgi:glycosyltransferase involved in cell wall biosynthesis